MTNRRDVVISLGVILSVLAVVAVLLRLQARKVKRVGLGIDDWTIIAGLVFSLVASAAAIAGAVDGNLGHHDYDAQGNRLTTTAQRIVMAKSVWVMQWTTSLGPGLTKISVILFYRRIFAVPNGTRSNFFSYLCWFMIFISVVWTISFFFANLLGCVPITDNWNYSGTAGHCADLVTLWMTQAISDVIIDGLILTLPWIPLSKLHMQRSKKLLIAGVFLLGAFTVIAGILRAYAFHQATTSTSKDHGYSYSPGLYWALIEADVGVISACLPCLGPIIGDRSVTSVIGRAQSAWSRIRGSTSSFSTSASSRTLEGGASDEESLRHKLTKNSSMVESTSRGSEVGEKQIVREMTVTQDSVLRSADDIQSHALFGQPHHQV